MLKSLKAPRRAHASSPPSFDQLRWNGDGLVAAIAQDHSTKAVLMLAWMNREALEETLRTGRVCYYSRAAKPLWRKGEQSGNQQHLREARLDCDGDTVLLLVDQAVRPATRGGNIASTSTLAKSRAKSMSP